MRLVWCFSLVGLALACRSATAPVEIPTADPPLVESAPDASSAPASLSPTPLPSEHGLRLVERWVGGAEPGDDVPVIVAVHGLGDSPENFAWSFDGFERPARVVLPAGPTPFGRGHAWMTIRTAEGRDRALAMQIDAAAGRVAALCRDLGEGGSKPILTGFSQGGMVSWAVAVRHPDTLAAAFPVAGYLAPALTPEPGAPIAPIIAAHGEADEIVPIDLDRDSIARLAGWVNPPQLRSYAGRRHVIAPEMRRALFADIETVLDAARDQPGSP